MGAITAIPDILQVAVGDYKSFRIQAASAISRGTVLSLDANGRAIPVVITGAAPKSVIGVALDSGAQYDYITVVYKGVVNVANGDDATAIAIGAEVIPGGYVGAVIAATAFTNTNIIGQVLDVAIAGGSYGRILLKLR